MNRNLRENILGWLNRTDQRDIPYHMAFAEPQNWVKGVGGRTHFLFYEAAPVHPGTILPRKQLDLTSWCIEWVFLLWFVSMSSHCFSFHPPHLTSGVFSLIFPSFLLKSRSNGVALWTPSGLPRLAQHICNIFISKIISWIKLQMTCQKVSIFRQ